MPAAAVEYVPDAQVEQADAPATLYVPAAHCTGSCAPAQEEPAGQVLQERDLLGLYEPAVHAVHAGACEPL